MEFLDDTPLDKAIKKQLFDVYDDNDYKRQRKVNKIRRMIKSHIKNFGGDRLFVIFELRDPLDPDNTVERMVVKYSDEAFNMYMNMINDPKNAWDYWNFADEENRISSDDAREVIEKLRPKDKRTRYLFPYSIGYFDFDHPNYDSRLTDREKEAWDRWFGTYRERERVGRFMKYGLDKEKLKTATGPGANFIRSLENVDFLEKELQIPWFSKYEDPIKEENEGLDPIKYDIYRVPCLLYAIKGQVDEETYREIESSKKIMGSGSKIAFVNRILKERGYSTTVYRICDKGENFYINNDKYNKDSTKEVKLMFWKDHWMKYYEVNLGTKTKPVCFIRVLEFLFREGLLYPYNIYEMAQKFGCYSFDSMLKMKEEEVLALIKERYPNGYEFKEGEDWDEPDYSDPKRQPLAVYFADFEASTDEKYHRPYLVAYQGFHYEGKGFDRPLLGYDNPKCEWLDRCGKNMLDQILIDYKALIHEKYHRDYNIKRDPPPRIYFFNLKYDFTFLCEYLTEVERIMKGNSLYSLKGTYKDHTGEKIIMEFWDAYPIFQSTLARAGNDYLTPEEKKTIKKEAYPYKLYTYEFFNSFGENYYVPAYLAKQVMEEDKYNEFIETLKETLVDDDDDEIRSSDIARESKVLIEGEVKTQYEFNWKKYAEFYCCQDVRILARVMNNMGGLLKAEGLEGIHGTPPFSLDLIKYRTASSLSYTYFMQTCLFNKEEEDWVPKFKFVFPKNILRYIIQKSIRGGRVMCRDNRKWYFMAHHLGEYLLDYDAVSLYPSAMFRLWISEGVPKLIKGDFNTRDFLDRFCTPEDDENRDKKYTDGVVHITWVNTKIKRHFPLLCIKDKKTKLNNYRNYENEEVDTWVNAIDLYNLIDFQEGEFKWDMAVVWNGPKHFEIRKSIKDLFEFRKANHGKGVEHPIQNVAKVMMNSIYGKSVLKTADKIKYLVDMWKWRKQADGHWERYNYWLEYLRANMYRIAAFTISDKEDKVEVTLYNRDLSHSFNIFGSDVLAMSKRIIGRVMALAEDLENENPGMGPCLFYTDTDSMHIRADMLEKLEERYREKYGVEIKGSELGQFHIDFDAPRNFKKGEKVLGAQESYFIMKKVYADKLIGDQESVGYHMRMKGIPSNVYNYEHYKHIYDEEVVEFDLLSKGKPSFYYEKGRVACRPKMLRRIGTREAKEKEKEDIKEGMQAVNNFLKVVNKRKREEGVSESEIETEDEEYEFKLPRIEEDTTQKLNRSFSQHDLMSEEY